MLRPAVLQVSVVQGLQNVVCGNHKTTQLSSALPRKWDVSQLKQR